MWEVVESGRNFNNLAFEVSVKYIIVDSFSIDTIPHGMVSMVSDR